MSIPSSPEVQKASSDLVTDFIGLEELYPLRLAQHAASTQPLLAEIEFLKGELAQEDKDSDALLARVTALEGELKQYATYIVREEDGERERWDRAKFQPDHACAECLPHSDLLIPGFQCIPHRARALLGGGQ